MFSCYTLVLLFSVSSFTSLFVYIPLHYLFCFTLYILGGVGIQGFEEELACVESDFCLFVLQVCLSFVIFHRYVCICSNYLKYNWVWMDDHQLVYISSEKFTKI